MDVALFVTSEATLPSLPERLKLLQGAGIPGVVIDDRSFADQVDCVVSNDRVGAELAVAHLVVLGHRRIAQLSVDTCTSGARDRLSGYRQVLKRARIALRP